MEGPPKKTQAALARPCGVRAPSVNDWISGKTKKIEGENLVNAAAFLGVSASWLATGKGPMRRSAPAEHSEPAVSQAPVIDIQYYARDEDERKFLLAFRSLDPDGGGRDHVMGEIKKQIRLQMHDPTVKPRDGDSETTAGRML